MTSILFLNDTALDEWVVQYNTLVEHLHNHPPIINALREELTAEELEYAMLENLVHTLCRSNDQWSTVVNHQRLLHIVQHTLTPVSLRLCVFNVFFLTPKTMFNEKRRIQEQNSLLGFCSHDNFCQLSSHIGMFQAINFYTCVLNWTDNKQVISFIKNIVLKELSVITDPMVAYKYTTSFHKTNNEVTEEILLQAITTVIPKRVGILTLKWLAGGVGCDRVPINTRALLTKIGDGEWGIDYVSDALDTLLTFTHDDNEKDNLLNKLLVLGKDNLNVYKNTENVHSLASYNNIITFYLQQDFTTTLPHLRKNASIPNSLNESFYKSIWWFTTKHLSRKSKRIVQRVMERIRLDATPVNRNGATLVNVLEGLWMYIISQDKQIKNEMIIRLSQEFLEMDNTCTTGYAARLCNVINGFHATLGTAITLKQQISTKLMWCIQKELDLIRNDIFLNDYARDLVTKWYLRQTNVENEPLEILFSDSVLGCLGQNKDGDALSLFMSIYLSKLYTFVKEGYTPEVIESDEFVEAWRNAISCN